MKSVILSLILLTISLAASAHPTDEMPLNRIGKGSKLIFKQDINIPPLYQYFSFEYGKVIPYLTPEEKPQYGCFLYMFTPTNIDRLIKSGKTIEILDISSYFGSLLSFKFPPEVPFTIVCNPAAMTIGDFKYEILDILDIQLPAPVEI